MEKKVVIVGAGLVGSLLGIYLAKRKYQVTIYERRVDMRTEKISGGRSINLALSDRGILALQKVSLADEVKKIAIPMNGRLIHHPDSSTAFQPYGKDGQYINSVSRSELNKKLMDLAESHGVRIVFEHKCESVDWKKREIKFSHTGKQSLQTINFDLLFGADGAFSATRLHHQLQHNRFDYHQSYIDCGYKELTIPPTATGDFAMEVNALHIWPRRDYMLIALPNQDRSFTCTLFFPIEGKNSFSRLDCREKIIDFFQQTFPDAVALMPNFIEEFANNPVSSLVTVKCYPWIRQDHFSLIGDAAHAMVPFFGQGMNCGFEDCRILDELIETHDHDWSQILRQFQKSRKPDADAIADMAVGNFREMSDRVADPAFLLQKKIEARMYDKYPDKWIPAYSQVTFSPHIHYADALRNATRQEAVMQQVMQLPGIQDKWSSDEIEQYILGKL